MFDFNNYILSKMYTYDDIKLIREKNLKLKLFITILSAAPFGRNTLQVQLLLNKIHYN